MISALHRPATDPRDTIPSDSVLTAKCVKLANNHLLFDAIQKTLKDRIRGCSDSSVCKANDLAAGRVREVYQ